MTDGELGALWNAALPATGTFDPGLVAHLRELAQRFLGHAIAPGAPLAQAVRLRMQGEIKLKGWSAFTAEQTIRYPDGLVWVARTRIGGLPVRGYDRLLGAEGAMDWRLFGLVPVMRASGEDVSRSAAGRMAGELCWLPTALLGEGVSWGEPEGDVQPLRVATGAGEVGLRLRIGSEGRLLECQIERWGNPDGVGYRYAPFGVVFDGERRFGPFTIGAEIRAGWRFPESAAGEFFRATLVAAEFR